MKREKRVYPTKAVKLKQVPVILIFHTKDGREVEVLAHKTVAVKPCKKKKK